MAILTLLSSDASRFYPYAQVKSLCVGGPLEFLIFISFSLSRV